MSVSWQREKRGFAELYNDSWRFCSDMTYIASLYPITTHSLLPYIQKRIWQNLPQWSKVDGLITSCLADMWEQSHYLSQQTHNSQNRTLSLSKQWASPCLGLMKEWVLTAHWLPRQSWLLILGKTKFYWECQNWVPFWLEARKLKLPTGVN